MERPIRFLLRIATLLIACSALLAPARGEAPSSPEREGSVVKLTAHQQRLVSRALRSERGYQRLLATPEPRNRNKAERLIRAALRNIEAACGSDSVVLGPTLDNLAVFLMEEKRVSEAQKVCERSRDIRRRELGPAHCAVGRSCALVAFCLLLRGKRAVALQEIDAALSNQEAGRCVGPSTEAMLEMTVDLMTRHGATSQADRAKRLMAACKAAGSR